VGRSNKGVSITVWSKDQDFSVMGFIVDHLDMLITEWYPGNRIMHNTKVKTFLLLHCILYRLYSLVCLVFSLFFFWLFFFALISLVFILISSSFYRIGGDRQEWLQFSSKAYHMPNLSEEPASRTAERETRTRHF